MKNIFKKYLAGRNNIVDSYSELEIFDLGPIFGYYVATNSDSLIFFSELGVSSFTPRGARSAKYREIKEISNSVLNKEKFNAQPELIIKHDGDVLVLPVDGVVDQFFDTFVVERYLKKAKFYSSRI